MTPKLLALVTMLKEHVAHHPNMGSVLDGEECQVRQPAHEWRV